MPKIATYSQKTKEEFNMKKLLFIPALMATIMLSAQAQESEWKYIGSVSKYKYYLAPLSKGRYYTFSPGGFREILVISKGGSMDLALPDRYHIDCSKDLIKNKTEFNWSS
ncbi:hypothetical protein [Limnohabitans sp. Rim28]|uniref:hypothetical protein n=1 Tax=Limnohabitans sp. Rim28 TaxID=1100720 RepID=UPI0010573589|nr:hypothetical protein [Limnohabitans sp. Rim28]